MYVQHQLLVFVAITRCNRSPCRHSCRFYTHQTHNSECSPHTITLLTASIWAIATVIHVLIDTTFVRANDGKYLPLHHKFQNQSPSQRSSTSVRGSIPRKPVRDQGCELCPHPCPSQPSKLLRRFPSVRVVLQTVLGLALRLVSLILITVLLCPFSTSRSTSD